LTQDIKPLSIKLEEIKENLIPTLIV